MTEVQPFSTVYLEFPSGLTVAASLRTVKFQDVVSSVELDAEIEFLRSTSLPDVGFGRFHDFAVHHGDTSTAEVSWQTESVDRSIIAHWERDLVVESNVLFDTLAKVVVTNLEHVVNLSLTVSFSGFLSQLLLELSEFGDR